MAMDFPSSPPMFTNERSKAQEEIRGFVNKGDMIEDFELENIAASSLQSDAQMDNDLS